MERQRWLIIAGAGLLALGLGVAYFNGEPSPKKKTIDAPLVTVECKEQPCKRGGALTVSVDGVRQTLKLNAFAEAGEQKVRLFANATVNASAEKMVLPYEVALSDELKDAKDWTLHFVFSTEQGEAVADVTQPLTLEP